MTLTSPQGTTTLIGSNNGGNNDNVYSGTIWDDMASNTVSDVTYINGITATPLIPEGAMSAFIGEDPNGTWTITITDNEAIDIGILSSWSLTFDTGRCGGEDIPTLSQWGMICLLLLLMIIGTVGIENLLILKLR